MKTLHPTNSNRLACTAGARRLGGRQEGLYPISEFAGFFMGNRPADGSKGGMFTRTPDSTLSSLANEHRLGSTRWQVRLAPASRTPDLG